MIGALLQKSHGSRFVMMHPTWCRVPGALSCTQGRIMMHRDASMCTVLQTSTLLIERVTVAPGKKFNKREKKIEKCYDRMSISFIQLQYPPEPPVGGERAKETLKFHILLAFGCAWKWRKAPTSVHPCVHSCFKSASLLLYRFVHRFYVFHRFSAVFLCLFERAVQKSA